MRALPLQTVHAKIEEGRLDECVMSLDEALQSLPAVVVTEGTGSSYDSWRSGPYHPECILREEDFESADSGEVVRIKSGDGRLLALASKPGRRSEIKKDASLDANPIPSDIESSG